MTSSTNNRGSAPVGYLGELDPVEAAAVRYLRLWSDGPESQCDVWMEFETALGESKGRIALKSFENLCALCSRYGRRPMMRHQINCRLLGADESCFANLIALAANGEREDAMLISTLLVRADFAPCIAALAAEVGLALKCIGLQERHTKPLNTEIPKHLH